LRKREIRQVEERKPEKEPKVVKKKPEEHENETRQKDNDNVKDAKLEDNLNDIETTYWQAIGRELRFLPIISAIIFIICLILVLTDVTSIIGSYKYVFIMMTINAFILFLQTKVFWPTLNLFSFVYRVFRKYFNNEKIKFSDLSELSKRQ